METGGAHLPMSSATCGALGPLQPSSQGWGLLNPMMLGNSISILSGAWLAGSRRTLQTILADSFKFFDLS